MAREGLIRRVIQDKNGVRTTKWVLPSAPLSSLREVPVAPVTPASTPSAPDAPVLAEAPSPLGRARNAAAVADYVSDLVGSGADVEPITGRSVEDLDAAASRRVAAAMRVVSDMSYFNEDPARETSGRGCQSVSVRNPGPPCPGPREDVEDGRYCALHNLDELGGDDIRAVRELAAPGALDAVRPA